MILTVLQVALGGALGASGRYLTGVAMTSLMGRSFPWGTLTVNILGSFLMGVLVVVMANFSATRLAPFLTFPEGRFFESCCLVAAKPSRDASSRIPHAYSARQVYSEF